MKRYQFPKTLAVLMLCLLLALTAGCAKTDPAPDNAPASGAAGGGAESGAAAATGALIEDSYFSLNEAGGWIFYSRIGSLTLVHGDPDSDISMEFISASLSTVEDELEDALSMDGAVQGETITCAGTEYFTVTCAEDDMIFLITSETHPVKDDEWNEILDLVVTVELSGADLEQAVPVLETLKFHDSVLKVTHEWPETEVVETEHFSYTATDGWYLYEKFDNPYSHTMPGLLQNDNFSPPAFMEISWVYTDPEDVVDKINFAFSGCEERGEITIAGITYAVYADEPDFGDSAAASTFLVTPAESGGTIEIYIQSVGAEGAMPVLETIKLKS